MVVGNWTIQLELLDSSLKFLSMNIYMVILFELWFAIIIGQVRSYFQLIGGFVVLNQPELTQKSKDCIINNDL